MHPEERTDPGGLAWDNPATLRLMNAWLECGDGRSVEVRGKLTIGRSSVNDLQINEVNVSRYHALIHHQAGSEYCLVDLSRNGTMLNGRRLTHTSCLEAGDTVEIGGHRMTFRRPAGGGETGNDGGGASRRTTEPTVAEARSEERVLLVADLCGFTRMMEEVPESELATMVGMWFAACRELVQNTGGSINKYLGDGFLATWPILEASADVMLRVHQRFAEMQRDAEQPKFRYVVHAGRLRIDTSIIDGEETLIGIPVNMAFRMEKIAGQHGRPRLWSRAAVDLMAERIAFSRVLACEVSGFPGTHEFFLDG